MPDALKEQVFSHLERLAAVAHLSEADRLAYDKAVDRYNVSRIVENDIWEKAMTEGRAKGHMEGHREGRMEGHREGRMEGLAEGYREVARKLKASGASIELIIQTTGLSAEDIAKL